MEQVHGVLEVGDEVGRVLEADVKPGDRAAKLRWRPSG